MFDEENLISIAIVLSFFTFRIFFKKFSQYFRSIFLAKFSHCFLWKFFAFLRNSLKRNIAKTNIFASERFGKMKRNSREKKIRKKCEIFAKRFFLFAGNLTAETLQIRWFKEMNTLNGKQNILKGTIIRVF